MASTVRSAEHNAVFELKGRMATLTVLRLLAPDEDALDRQLDAHVARGPSVLRGLPVIIDLHPVGGGDPRGLSGWVEIIRRRGLVPVGVFGASPPVEAAAHALGLGVFPELSGSPVPRAVERVEAQQSQAQPSQTQSVETKPVPGRIIDHPVRSGQQIYVPGGDLIVLSSVSPGAELMADGHIHVYGALRGRALAGVQGNEKARILCHNLKAELVSIAGWYKLSDQMGGVKEGPVQIFLKDETVCIAPMDARH